MNFGSRILFAFVLAGVCGWMACAEGDGRPNVVLIISDDQSWTDYGFMGHPVIQTPHLDRLSEQGATYRRGYVPTALCRPSLASIATGLYAHQHGITGNDPASLTHEDRARVISFMGAVPTLQGLLGEAGYVSLQTGKWWEGKATQMGFTEGMTRGFPEKGGRHGDDGLKIGRNGMEPIFSFIDKAREQSKPFFIWYAPFMPHTPHTPPGRLLKKYLASSPSENVAKYYAMCDWFDETCGELMGYLDKKGISDNTLVAYVCDNGWIQSAPDAVLPDGWKAKYGPRSKQSAYEGGVRNPIMLRWPGHIKPKSDEKTLVSSIDLMPTILEACGVDVPEGLPGLSLLDDAMGRAALQRDTIFGESFAHDIADVERPEASLRYRWCIDGKWKLLLVYQGKLGRHASSHSWEMVPVKLYDLMADPHEEVNLAEQHPEIVSRLSGKLEAWWPLPEDAPKFLGN